MFSAYKPVSTLLIRIMCIFKVGAILDFFQIGILPVQNFVQFGILFFWILSIRVYIHFGILFIRDFVHSGSCPFWDFVQFAIFAVSKLQNCYF